MEPSNNCYEGEHGIDMPSSDVSFSPSSSHYQSLSNSQQQQSRNDPSTRTSESNYRSTLSNASGESSSRSMSLVPRENGRPDRRIRFYMTLEFLLAVIQIVAGVVALSFSRNEHPHAPLFAWVIVYVSACVAVLTQHWIYSHLNQGSNRDPSQSRQSSYHGNVSGGQEGSDDRTTDIIFDDNTYFGISRARLEVLLKWFPLAHDCFFIIWFVVGIVWVFGDHASASEAPNLFRLCIVFLTVACFLYVIPLVLCAMCCWLSCIISLCGFREDPAQNGATSKLISSLPTYKVKAKNKNLGKNDSNNPSGEGGDISAGTEKERVISGDDAVCSICLAKYVVNDEIKELPCYHFFHKKCATKWLKINATCPLCKSKVSETLSNRITEISANQQQSTTL